MATDFFERQTVARRSTGWLVWLFLLAVVGILVGTYAAAWAACEYVATTQTPPNQQPPAELDYVPLWAALAALVLILLGSLFKIAQLRGGGTVVAEHVGGRRIYPNTSDPTEKKILNVVEEMALASGVPVPPVYLLGQEQGINAFAAGYSPSDAVIGVTRGCADELSRDELQGVIAHEFSHILNGDMRLNIRLIGILHGILLLGLIGQMIFRIVAYSGGGSRRSNSGRGGGGALLAILLLGLAMIVLGYLGTFMGNLIKAAVSRQREFLADSSALQFTRNPDGIAGALKQIGGLMSGSKVKHPSAAEASHMYFAKGVGTGLTSLLATHPPLENRIRRLDPDWDGKFPQTDARRTATIAGGQVAGFAGGETTPPGPRAQETAAQQVQHASVQVGDPTEQHQIYAAELIRSMPDRITEAAHDPYGARAVLFALLLDHDAGIREHQLGILRKMATPDVVDLTLELLPVLDELDDRARLPLVDMSLPALRAMSRPQYRTFVTCFQELVKADERLALFEWALHQVLLRHLKPQFEQVKNRPVIYWALGRLGEPISVLLSTLAHVSHNEQEAQAAFSSAESLLSEVHLQLLPRAQCSLHQLQGALEKLTQVSVRMRRRVIDAAAVCICADHEVTVREAELLRAICDMLDCPTPPLLAGQEVAQEYVSSSHTAPAAQ